MNTADMNERRRVACEWARVVGGQSDPGFVGGRSDPRVPRPGLRPGQCLHTGIVTCTTHDDLGTNGHKYEPVSTTEAIVKRLEGWDGRCEGLRRDERRREEGW